MIDRLVNILRLHKIVHVEQEYYEPLRGELDRQRIKCIVIWDNSFQRYVFMEE